MEDPQVLAELDTIEVLVGQIRSTSKHLNKYKQKIQLLERENDDKSKRIETLEKEALSLRGASRRNNSLNLNVLNGKLNQALKENEELRREIEELKYKRRTPLSPIKTDNEHNTNILDMLKQSSAPISSDRKSKDIEFIRHEVMKKVDDTQLSSSQNPEQLDLSSELSPTQFTLDGEESDPINSAQLKPQAPAEPQKRRQIPMIQESVDLRAKNFDMLSSPVREEFSSQKKYGLESSPISNSKVKQESGDSVEILDSQGDEEEAFNLAGHFPTPKTATKLRTPLNLRKINFRKSMLYTPNDTTPMKNTKKSKTSKVYDFSRNPDKKRDWIIEDFKINPEKNNNLDFAYDDVLRGVNRQCAHGKSCKDCEQFYKNVGGDVLIKQKQSGLRWNDQSNYYSMNSTTPNNLISKTSRHRSIWDRVESPPGFGDFDFPNTQEQQKNREKSDMIRKRKAYERLYSAINHGRFMFRDEKFNEALKNRNFTIDEEVFDRYVKNVDTGK